MEDIVSGAIFRRGDSNSLYMLTALGDHKYALVSLSEKAGTWSGVHTCGGSFPTESEWHSIQSTSEFEFVTKFPNVKYTDLCPAWEEEAKALMWDNKKVAAIRVCRVATKLGLKEAKEYCEAHFPMERDDPTLKSPF